MTIDLVSNPNQDFNPILDYVPVISTAHALKSIFDKAIYLPKMSAEDIKKSKYYTYLDTSTFTRQLVLLVPVIGNLMVYLKDRFYVQKQKPLEPALLPNNPLKPPQDELAKNKEIEVVKNEETAAVEIKEIVFEESHPFNFEFFSNKNHLFLDLTLLEGVQAPESYSYRKDSFNLYRFYAEAIFKPATGYKLLSTKYGQLLDVKFTVELENSLDKNSLNSVIVVNSKYKQEGKETSTTSTYQYSLNHPSINFDKYCEFHSSEKERLAWFVFFNAFRNP